MTLSEMEPGGVQPAGPLLEGAPRGRVAHQHVDPENGSTDRLRRPARRETPSRSRAPFPAASPRRGRAAPDIPAARLVTSDTAATRTPGVAGGDDLEDGGHPHQVGAQRRSIRTSAGVS